MLAEIFRNLSIGVNVDMILLKIRYLWLWALIGNAILTAFFLIVALACMEAGGKAKSKWLSWTVCSLVVMAGLIIFKPKTNKEEIQYMPAPSTVADNVVESKDTATKKSTSKSNVSSGGSSSGDKSESTTGKTQGQQGQTKVSQEKHGGESGTKSVTDNKQTTPSIQDQLNDSLKKKGNPNGGYKDPVLEEILELKRQAEENSKETASEEESPEQQFIDSGSSSEGQTDDQITDINDEKAQEQQLQKQKVVKARVLVSTLNVRDKGSLDGQIIGLLNTGDIVEVIDSSGTGDWSNIKSNSGLKGWVLKKHLEILP